jgi:hypothetical protein
MELLCPSCQQRLTIPDQYAGQLMKCPLCANMFTAPALQSMPAAPIDAPKPPPPPPGAPSSRIMEGVAPFPLPPSDSPAPQPAAESAVTAEPAFAATPLPSDSQRTWTIWFSPRVVPWIAPICMALLFILTFLPWWVSERGSSFNAWSLSFGDHSNLFFSFWLVLSLLALVVAIPSLLLTLKLIPAPPALAVIEPWRPVIVGGLVFLSFLCFFVKYVELIFHAAPMTVWMRLSFCLHLVAVIGSFLEFWLATRGPSKPMPRLEMHW